MLISPHTLIRLCGGIGRNMGKHIVPARLPVHWANEDHVGKGTVQERSRWNGPKLMSKIRRKKDLVLIEP